MEFAEITNMQNCKKGNYCKIPFLFSGIIIIKTSTVLILNYYKMAQSNRPVKKKVGNLNSFTIPNKHIITVYKI